MSFRIGVRSRLVVLLVCLTAVGCGDKAIKIGSKSFTESVILGDMATLLARSKGYPADHVRELGGTRVVWDALRSGEIDVYPEYTGTLRQELFAAKQLADDQQLRDELAQHGVSMTEPLGFNNSYAIGMKRERAEELGVRSISDLRKHLELEFGFSNEFMNRADGWPALRDRYQLPQRNVTGLQHTLAYQALDNRAIDAVDVYVTDPHVEMYDLVILEDDLQHFPRYDAVFLYRNEIAEKAPDFLKALEALAGNISDNRMGALNRQAQIDRVSEIRVAADFLSQDFGVRATFREPSLMERLARSTVEHLWLVSVSLAAAIGVSIPLGIIAAKRRIAGQLIVGCAEILQTIPGLALLVFMAVLFVSLGLRSIGPWPVIVALFLYSLLPIIRNTMAGLTGVPHTLVESADALGLSPWAKLRLVELPLASPLILAGIKTTAVINVGYAALGGLIGAGGYGQPIMTGLRQNSVPLMMEGAIPAALLALLVKAFFALTERMLVPRGLRL